MLWAGELVHVPDGNESHSQPPEEDIIILDPPSRTPQGVSLETGTPRASQGTRGCIRSITAPPSQNERAASLMMPPPSTPLSYGSLDFRRGVPPRPTTRGRGAARPSTPWWRRWGRTRPPTTLQTLPETGTNEAYNAETSISSRGNGGNAEAMGQRGRGMGHDAVHGHGEYVQEYNGAENTVPAPQGDTSEPLGLCPQGTEGRWLCGTQFCARGNWAQEQICLGCNRQKRTRGGGGGGGAWCCSVKTL